MKHSRGSPSFLLINPPIYDFAAFDLWSKPLGLLYIASILEGSGANVNIIDYLDRSRPAAKSPKSNKYGCGKYFSKEIKKPFIFKHVPRRYKRYGMPYEEVKSLAAELERPDMILVSSSMTYWYPGVQEAVRTVRDIFPGVPIVLGGTYASLCPEHAANNSGADHIVPGQSLDKLAALIRKHLNLKIEMPLNFKDFPPPYTKKRIPSGAYAVIRTGTGCPYDCSYCAIKAVSENGIQRKTPGMVAGELRVLSENGVNNTAFYDDALLFDPENHIEPLLESLIAYKMNMLFHTPNGLHAKYLGPRTAQLLKKAGFVMPRISLETTDTEMQVITGGKVSNEEFRQAAAYLKEAGYGPGEYTAYVMMGIPGQDLAATENSLCYANRLGARVSISEYSPIPQTRDWHKIKESLPSDDPLWHNNSVYPLLNSRERQAALEIKLLAKRLNRCFT